MTLSTYPQVRDEARRLLRKFGLTDVMPVPVETIAYALGAQIYEGHLSKSRAAVRRMGSSVRIRLSDMVECSADRRFSIGHETGHLVLGHRAAHKAAAGGVDPCVRNPWNEREADVFAAELLMPERRVRAESASIPVSFESARTLAGTFDVPTLPATIRFVELSDLPCALVCASGGRVSWVVTSATFCGHIERGAVVRPGSIAHACGRGATRSGGRSVVDATVWFDRHPAHHVVGHPPRPRRQHTKVAHVNPCSSGPCSILNRPGFPGGSRDWENGSNGKTKQVLARGPRAVGPTGA